MTLYRRSEAKTWLAEVNKGSFDPNVIETI